MLIGGLVPGGLDIWDPLMKGYEQIFGIINHWLNSHDSGAAVTMKTSQ